MFRREMGRRSTDEQYAIDEQWAKADNGLAMMTKAMILIGEKYI